MKQLTLDIIIYLVCLIVLSSCANYKVYSKNKIDIEIDEYKIPESKKNITYESMVSSKTFKLEKKVKVHQFVLDKDLGKCWITIEVTTRGASSIFIISKAGQKPTFDVISHGFSIEADHISGDREIENFMYVEIKEPKIVYMTIVINNSFEKTIEDTIIRIKRIPIGEPSVCPFKCTNNSKCIKRQCKCDSMYFGTTCNKKIHTTEKDTFKLDGQAFQKFDALYFKEEFEKKTNKIKFTVKIFKPINPSLGLVINEFDGLADNTFGLMNVTSENHLFHDFGLFKNAISSQTFTIVKKVGLFTIIRFSNEPNILFFQLKITQSDDALMNVFSYILYILIMISISTLFFLVIFASCIGNVKEERDENMIHPVEREFNFNQFEQNEDDDIDKPTLTEGDYERWMPVINLKDEKRKGHKIYDVTCSICIEKIENGEMLRRIKICKHTFHANCLKNWLNVNEKCPNCNEELTKLALKKKEKQIWKKQGLIIPKKRQFTRDLIPLKNLNNEIQTSTNLQSSQQVMMLGRNQNDRPSQTPTNRGTNDSLTMLISEIDSNTQNVPGQEERNAEDLTVSII